jgi:hypothetical protein
MAALDWRAAIGRCMAGKPPLLSAFYQEASRLLSSARMDEDEDIDGWEESMETGVWF